MKGFSSGSGRGGTKGGTGKARGKGTPHVVSKYPSGPGTTKDEKRVTGVKPPRPSGTPAQSSPGSSKGVVVTRVGKRKPSARTEVVSPTPDLTKRVQNCLTKLQTVDGLFVPDPGNPKDKIDSGKLIGKDGPNQDMANRFTAMLKLPDVKPDSRILNNRGCAHAWAFDFNAAQADFEKTINGEIKDELGGLSAAEQNLGVLAEAWDDWETWRKKRGGK